MNAGFSNLATLKQNILVAPALVAATDYDTRLLAIGLGVVKSFEQYCNRDFQFTMGEQDVAEGDRDHWYTRRSPVTQFTQVELRYFKSDAWTNISGQPLAADEGKGLIHFGYTLGRRPIQVRITYNGGYWWPVLEPTDAGYPDTAPAEITNNPAGISAAKFNLPDDLRLAWLIQCRKVWEAIDKIGDKVSEVGSNTKNPSEALAGLDLVPQVRTILDRYKRYQIT